MRVSRDPNDKAYTEDEYQVWVNDVEVLEWFTADDFRRVVITESGKVINGPVGIRRVNSGDAPAAAPTAPVTGSFSGLLEVVPKERPKQRNGKRRR